MRIGVLKESAPRERRVSLSPDAVATLVRRGDSVVVERGAGAASFFPDESYLAAGATIGSAAEAAGCEVVATVRGPSPALVAEIPAGSVVLGLFGTMGARDLLGRTDVTTLALEKVPRITRAQSMDVLSSQATVVGYQAVLRGTTHLPRFLPMLTTAAGSIAPAKALVLGAGVAGLQAIATARRLGAQVFGFDVRPAAAEQVKSLGARFIAPDAVTAEAESAGGYARELAAEQQERVLAAVAAAIAPADLVICTAAIPGKAAPRLVTEAMVASMKPGSVIVDASAETGGNCELTRPGDMVVAHGVTIDGPLDLASTLPQHASQMFGRNVRTLIEHLAPEGTLALNDDDEIVSAMRITGGAV
jgi:NAD(P) transhydrogenase subunit alpha